MTSQETLTRVALDGDALVFRVVADGKYEDRVFVRDLTKPRGNNVWTQLPSYRALADHKPTLEGVRDVVKDVRGTTYEEFCTTFIKTVLSPETVASIQRDVASARCVPWEEGKFQVPRIEVRMTAGTATRVIAR